MLDLIAVFLMLQNGSWAGIPPIPEARQEVGIVAVEGLVYVIGGIDSNGLGSARVDAFDTHTGTWKPVPPVPIPLHHPMVAAIGHKIYVAGGYTNPDFTPHARTYEFDPDLSVWNRKADMFAPRGAGAAASYNGKMYVFGGERFGQSVSEVAAYDPVTDSWASLPSMPTARNHHGAALVRGVVYVIGGRPGNLSANEAFDVATATWKTKASLPTARSGIAVAASGPYVYVFGGEGNPRSPAGTFSETEAYNPEKDAWLAVEAMPLPRHGIGAGVVGNRIYIPAGGPVEGFGTTAQSDFFEIAQDIVLPQFVVGGGYRTEIFVANPSARSADVNVSLLDLNGAPLSTTLDGSPRAGVSVSIPSLASRIVSAPDTAGTLRVGTVRIRSNVRLSIFGVVHAPGAVVTVYPVAPSRRAILPFRLARVEQTTTGLAVTNTGIAAALVTLALVNESGIEMFRTERRLEPREQLSRFIDELFPVLQQTDFQGTITVTSSEPLAVVGLGFGRDGVITLPVVPIE